MAAKTQDYTKVMKDMMGAFPVDTTAMQDAFKTQAAFADKMSKVVLDAAEKSTEVSSAWTKATIGKLGVVTNAKSEPADYTKAITDFASFAEIAKKVQMETVELMMAAGKDFSEDASAAVKKATNDMTAAAKKAATAK